MSTGKRPPTPGPKHDRSPQTIELAERLADAEATLRGLMAKRRGAMLEPLRTTPTVLRKVRAALLRTEEELEACVTERTADLAETNKALEAEIAARRRTDETTARLACFPELNPNPVFEADLNGRVHYANPAAIRLSPEILTKGPKHPWLTDLPSAVATLQRADRTSLSREVKLGDAWYHETLFAAPDSQRIRAYAFDITERKWAEAERERLIKQLETEKVRWQATVESMLDPVTTCDAEGRATYMNAAYSRLVERDIREGLDLEDHAVHYQLYRPDGCLFETRDLPLQRAALSGEEVRNVEVMQRTPSGGERITIWNAAPLHDVEGRLAGAVAVGRDITEQRRAEENLKRYQLLAERARDLVLFVRRDGRILEANEAAIAAYGYSR